MIDGHPFAVAYASKAHCHEFQEDLAFAYIGLGLHQDPDQRVAAKVAFPSTFETQNPVQ